MRCVATRNTLTIGGTRLRALVKKYIAQHRSNALQEKEFFEQMPSLQLAVYHAAFALDHRQPPRRYSHQCRIRLAPMREAHQMLLRARTKLESTKSFDELHALVAGIFEKIHGLGVLYAYDTALRLGFYLRMEPTSVYLHAGTLQGARALGIRATQVVQMRDLPLEIRALPPHEVENFLCIYKPRTEG